jgi:hypothetical protein
VNAVPAEDEGKHPAIELKQLLKESVERYIAYSVCPNDDHSEFNFVQSCVFDQLDVFILIVRMEHPTLYDCISMVIKHCTTLTIASIAIVALRFGTTALFFQTMQHNWIQHINL